MTCDANAHDALAHARRALDQFLAVGDHAGQAAAFGAVGRSLALCGLAEDCQSRRGNGKVGGEGGDLIIDDEV